MLDCDSDFYQCSTSSTKSNLPKYFYERGKNIYIFFFSSSFGNLLIRSGKFSPGADISIHSLLSVLGKNVKRIFECFQIFSDKIFILRKIEKIFP